MYHLCCVVACILSLVSPVYSIQTVCMELVVHDAAIVSANIVLLTILFSTVVLVQCTASLPAFFALDSVVSLYSSTAHLITLALMCRRTQRLCAPVIAARCCIDESLGKTRAPSYTPQTFCCCYTTLLSFSSHSTLCSIIDADSCWLCYCLHHSQHKRV